MQIVAKDSDMGDIYIEQPEREIVRYQGLPLQIANIPNIVVKLSEKVTERASIAVHSMESDNG